MSDSPPRVSQLLVSLATAKRNLARVKREARVYERKLQASRDGARFLEDSIERMELELELVAEEEGGYGEELRWLVKYYMTSRIKETRDDG